MASLNNNMWQIKYVYRSTWHRRLHVHSTVDRPSAVK